MMSSLDRDRDLLAKGRRKRGATLVEKEESYVVPILVMIGIALLMFFFGVSIL